MRDADAAVRAGGSTGQAWLDLDAAARDYRDIRAAQQNICMRRLAGSPAEWRGPTGTLGMYGHLRNAFDLEASVVQHRRRSSRDTGGHVLAQP